MKLFLSCLPVVMGVRRLPGAGTTLEDLVGGVHPGKIAALPTVLSSMLQNNAGALWLANDSYSAVISNLTENLINVVIGENDQAQTDVEGLINIWGQWMSFAEAAKVSATEAEDNLRRKLVAEQAAATAYKNALDSFKDLLSKVVEDCTEQEIIEDFNNCVTDVSKSCPPHIDYLVQSGLATAHVSVSSDDHIDNYAAAQNSCTAQKNAIENYWDEDAQNKNTYTEWQSARTAVSIAFEDRKQAICGETSVCSSDGEAVGLQNAFKQVCASKGFKDGEEALIEARNNSKSLGDRNYELDALYTVKCLLEKLNSFTDDQYQSTDNDVSALVSGCESDSSGNANTNVVINYKSKSESGKSILASNDQTCFSASANDRWDTDIEASMQTLPVDCLSQSTVVIGTGGVAGGAGHIQGVSPSESFLGDVAIPEQWADINIGESKLGCSWYCVSLSIPLSDTACDVQLQGRRYISCDADVIKAGKSELLVPSSGDYSPSRGDTERTVSVGNDVSFDDCVSS